MLHCWTSSRIFPATMRTFTKDAALSEQGRGAAWHVWINARHGRGTAWARHVMCESALNSMCSQGHALFLNVNQTYQRVNSYSTASACGSALCTYRNEVPRILWLFCRNIRALFDILPCSLVDKYRRCAENFLLRFSIVLALKTESSRSSETLIAIY